MFRLKYIKDPSTLCLCIWDIKLRGFNSWGVHLPQNRKDQRRHGPFHGPQQGLSDKSAKFRNSHPVKDKFIGLLMPGVSAAVVSTLRPPVPLVPRGEITRAEWKGANYPYSPPFMRRSQPSAKCLFTFTLHHWRRWWCRTKLYNAGVLMAATSSALVDLFSLSLFHTHARSQQKLRPRFTCLTVTDQV